MEIPEVNLGTIGNGAALELFQRELARVLSNIKDPNTNATKKRRLTLVFDFEPYNDRSGAAVEIKVESKLQATTGVDATLFIQRIPGGFQALTRDARQDRFAFDDSEEKPEPQRSTSPTQ